MKNNPAPSVISQPFLDKLLESLIRALCLYQLQILTDINESFQRSAGCRPNRIVNDDRPFAFFRFESLSETLEFGRELTYLREHPNS